MRGFPVAVVSSVFCAGIINFLVATACANWAETQPARALRPPQITFQSPIWSGFFLNLLFYAPMIWLVARVPRAVRRYIRTRHKRCAACGYPIGVSERCTECGNLIGLRPGGRIGVGAPIVNSHPPAR